MIKIIIVSLIFLYSNLYSKTSINIDFTAFAKNDFQFTLNPKRKNVKFINATILINEDDLLSESDIKSIEIYNPILNKKLYFKPHICCDKLSIIINIPFKDILKEGQSFKRDGYFDYTRPIIHLDKLSTTRWYKNRLKFFNNTSKLIISYKNKKSQIYSIKFRKSFEQVVKELENEYKSSIRWNIFGVILAYLIGLVFIYKILKKLIPYLYKKDKYYIKQFQEKKQNYKIKRIEEDEIIRTNIKKSLNDEQTNEIEDLQEIINNALAKGDTETAQSLLKILNKKKGK